MYFGACYYPEHWPEERWQTDVGMMKEAGFNLVRIGEFAWTRIERTDGEFTFEWLDRIIGMLGEAGIKTVLGTPTASPPKWIMDRHPDLYKRDIYGHVRGFGTRMHYCFNHQGYHDYVRRIVGAMAERYKDHPDVIGWQIDNEFGCVNTTWCYCDTCRMSFQAWLRERYGTIDALNESWGTVVWNHTYNAFDEIETPKLTVYQLHNPGLQLDYRRFSSDAVCKYQQIQIDRIRSAGARQPITHNMMGTFNEIDYYKLSAPLDVAGLDIYPNFPHDEPINHYTPALHHDMTRGFKGGANYWVLEHQSGAPGANILKETPKPGELRRWTYQSIARGADALLYFRWRTAVFGAEQYWHGILQHSGKPGRKYEEVCQVGAELALLSPHLAGSMIQNEAAIVRCFENDWVFDIQPHNPGHAYLHQVMQYHRYFVERGIGVDVIAPESDLGAYKLLVLPHLALTDDRLAERIHRYVEGGGTVLLDWRAGSKLPDNRMRSEAAPGPFRELLGIEIDDYGIIPRGESRAAAFGEGQEACVASEWYEVVELCGAEAVARYAADYYSGAPAVTVRRSGLGRAYYAGTTLDKAGRAMLLDRLCGESGVQPVWRSGHPLVEAAVRRKGDRDIVFAINHAAAEVTVHPPAGSVDLLSGERLSGAMEMEPNGVLVFAIRR